VPVLTALNNTGGIYEAILPALTGSEASLDGRIAPGSKFYSDITAKFVKATVKTSTEHRQVIVPTVIPHAVKVRQVPTKRRQKGRLGLGRVNAHHGQIKVLINGRCRGAATQYLGNYLAGTEPC
jgi:hypothetical protein